MEFLMSKFTSALKAFVADENGITAIEYGLIAALIGAAVVAAVTQLKAPLIAAFNQIGTSVQGHATGW
jgi:pilus assembly protein Flp/PilA